jgi:glycosyltransferase involved in cell wall biosynthesis
MESNLPLPNDCETAELAETEIPTATYGRSPGPASGDAGNRLPRVPIRIAYCIDNAGVGGTELNAVRSAELLDPARFNLVVFTLKDGGPLIDRYRKRGIEVLPLRLRSLYNAQAFRQGFWFARELRRRSIAVLHTHDFYSNIFGVFWGRVARRPSILASRRWWNDLPTPRLRLANRHAFQFADKVLANSDRVGQAVAHFDAVGRDRVAVIPNFVDDELFLPPDRSAIRKDRYRLDPASSTILIGMVARLAPEKGHRDLFLALQLLRTQGTDAHLVLVGDGPCRPELIVLAQELGISDHVTFAGEQPDGARLIAACDIAVLPSHSEGFPNAIIEAMAAGRAIVATEVGGTPDAITNEETGLLVPVASPLALAFALARVINDPVLRVALGRRAQAKAKQEYGAAMAAARLARLYEQLAR